MNGSSNVLVLGVTGQVGKRVATNLKSREAKLSVGSRRKANLRELADHGRQARRFREMAPLGGSGESSAAARTTTGPSTVSSALPW